MSTINKTTIKKIIDSISSSYKDIPETIIAEILKSPSLINLVLEKEKELYDYNQSFFKKVVHYYNDNNLNIEDIKLHHNFFKNCSFSQELHLLSSQNPESVLNFFSKTFQPNDNSYYSNFVKLYSFLPENLKKDKELFKGLIVNNPIILVNTEASMLSPLSKDEELEFIVHNFNKFSNIHLEAIFSNFTYTHPNLFQNKDVFKKLLEKCGKIFHDHNINYAPLKWLDDYDILSSSLQCNTLNYRVLSHEKKLGVFNYENPQRPFNIDVEQLPIELKTDFNFLKQKKLLKFEKIGLLPYSIQNILIKDKNTSNFFTHYINENSLDTLIESVINGNLRKEDLSRFWKDYVYLPEYIKSDLNINLKILETGIKQDFASSSIYNYFHPDLKENSQILNLLKNQNGFAQLIFLFYKDGDDVIFKNTNKLSTLLENFYEDNTSMTIKKLHSANIFHLLLKNETFNEFFYNHQKENNTNIFNDLSQNDKFYIISSFLDYYKSIELHNEMQNDLKENLQNNKNKLRKF